MCGIAGFYFKNPDKFVLKPEEIEDLVDCLLLGIEHRGQHATGIAVQDIHGISSLEKADMPASRFIFWRQNVVENARTVILHTRMYTKGKPENLLNNHPVQYHNIMMTHNGHISNDDELFKDEELERFAEVDSEIIPALLHKYSFCEPKEALEKMSGGYAIAAIDEENPGKLLLAKGPTSPLTYLETEDMWIWASEEKAIKEAMFFAIDWDVKAYDCKYLKHGEYILVDGENHRRADFSPYVKPYVTKQSTGVYSTKTGGHNPNSITDDWHNYNDQCDDCFVYFPRHQLNRHNSQYYCDKCEANLFDIDSSGIRTRKQNTKKLSRKERKRLRKEAQRRFHEAQKQEEKKGERKLDSSPRILDAGDMEIGKILDEEHKLVCGMVAEFYGTKGDFVDMILFSDELIAEDDPNLCTMYLEFEQKYEEYLESVRGTTDIILNKVTEKTKNNPVGFGGCEI